MTDSESTVTVHVDVPFREVDGETLRVDVYEPDGREGPLPVVVLVRGGGFVVGDKGEFARHGIDFASAGYLAIEPQYRLAPKWQFPAATSDVRGAIEWVKTDGREYGADPDRVAAIGHSAGATLVAFVAATAGTDDPAGVSAAVGYSGIYDFQAVDFDALDPDDPNIYEQYLGGPIEERPETYERASPAARADESMPPTLLLHGAKDEAVPTAQSDRFAAVLEDRTEVESERIPSTHAFPFQGPFYDDVYERTRTFLERHVIDG